MSQITFLSASEKYDSIRWDSSTSQGHGVSECDYLPGEVYVGRDLGALGTRSYMPMIYELGTWET